jgi:hypothetical protein
MSLAEDDERLLRELCEQHGVSAEKVLKLLETVQDYELKDLRAGVYDALRDILKTRFSADAEAKQ